MPTTPAERKALLFLGAVAVLGVGGRVVAGVRGGEDRVGPMQPALERQLARAEDAARRAREERAAREARKQARGAKRASGGERAVAAGGKGSHAARDSNGPRPPVDLDTADSIALATLPGVGPALARRIIEDRARHGAFGSSAALDGVPGVGPRLLERLAPHVTFSGPRRPIPRTGQPASEAGRGSPGSRGRTGGATR